MTKYVDLDGTKNTNIGVAEIAKPARYGFYAHISGGGPRGKRCVDCGNCAIVPVGQAGDPPSGTYCRKAFEMLRQDFDKRSGGQRIRRTMSACRYFVEISK